MLSRREVLNVITGTTLALTLHAGSASVGHAQDGKPVPEAGSPPSADRPAPERPAPAPRPLERAPGQDDDTRIEPESRLQPQPPPYGGCRYRERTLELIV
jgi:hypothetical protein